MSRSPQLLALILAFIVGCPGCSVVESRGEYGQGTAALKAGDYNTAILHLEKSVQESPLVAEHQYNLAAAYYADGRYNEGWPHSRKGVLLAPGDRVARNNFRLYVTKFGDQMRGGDSEATIRRNLGRPDKTLRKDDGDFWQYGSLVLRFQNGRLYSVEDTLAR